jgi:toxin ParE1/3/4
MKVFVSDHADADLAQIKHYLAKRSPAAVLSLSHELDRTFQNLSDFPFIGRKRPTLGDEIRSISIHPYVVFYMVEADCVVIVRVLHGRRDIDAEFRR